MQSVEPIGERSMKIHLIMPMGGKGSRFSQYGYEFPKPLLEIKGKPFFYWATQSIAKFVDVEDIVFVVLKEHVEKYEIDKKIKEYYPNAILHVIPKVLNGAVLTCMEGMKEIKDNAPIVFNDCDHIFRSSEFETFLEGETVGEVDGALLTFPSDSPKYSFLRLDEKGNVTETVEKEVISNQAICGCYYFANEKCFLDSAKEYLNHCDYQEFFVSGVYNMMVQKGAVIKPFMTDFHVPFGVPEEYEEAKKSDFFEELQ